MLDFDNDDEDIFPLTANLGTSCVDPSNLVTYMTQDDSNIGMKNFKSRRHFNNNNNNNASKPAFQQSASCPAGSMSKAKLMWRMAALRVRSLGDPWSDFKIDAIPVETCIRHRLGIHVCFFNLSNILESLSLYSFFFHAHNYVCSSNARFSLSLSMHNLV